MINSCPKNTISRIIFILLLIGTNQYNIAQNVAINESGSAPNSSAMLDVSSTAKGMLIPRMTEVERTAISSPATGLVVYQTDGTEGFYYKESGGWVRLVNHTALASPSPVFLRKSADYTITTTDLATGKLILYNFSSSPLTHFTLPLAGSVAAGSSIYITIDGPSSSYFNVICSGTDTFSGFLTDGATDVISDYGGGLAIMQMVSDGVDRWYVIGVL